MRAHRGEAYNEAADRVAYTSLINLEKFRKVVAKRTFEANDLILRSYYEVKLGSSSQVDFSRIVGNSFVLQHCCTSHRHASAVGLFLVARIPINLFDNFRGVCLAPSYDSGTKTTMIAPVQKLVTKTLICLAPLGDNGTNIRFSVSEILVWNVV